MESPYIPAKTVDKMTVEHPEGTRHFAAMQIAIPLIGNGMSPAAVYAQLRSQFPSDVTDEELIKIVKWAESKNPSPSGFGFKNPYPVHTPTKIPAPKPHDPVAHCRWWLSGAECTPESVSAASPMAVPPDPKTSLQAFLSVLYEPEDQLNIITKFTQDEQSHRTAPCGAGKALPARLWAEWVSGQGVPHSKAGAWLRMNPCKPVGSGADGAMTDADIVRFRYLLLESDVLPLPMQLALLTKLSLPIVAIFSSGGKSVHAWVKVDAPDLKAYQATATAILGALSHFGVDQANKNASRLSRLPGAVRTHGAVGDGVQRLLWLNPAPKELDMHAFTESLKLPALNHQPFKSVILDSLDRYEELAINKGRNGIMTGIHSFDHDTGGLKKGNLLVISAETNGGKTSVCMNFINAAISAGHGVALFTLEMDRGEICDMLVAMNCRVNRNHFNSGEFTNNEVQSMTAKSSWFAQLPLWVEDAPTMTVTDIRDKTMQLVREKKIGMVVVDYIQLITSENPNLPREQQIAAASRAMKALAKEAHVPIVVVSQLNEEGKLRESRVIGHDANIVAAVEDIDDQPKFHVVKGRSIPKRVHPFIFEPVFCLVKNPSMISDADVPR